MNSALAVDRFKALDRLSDGQGIRLSGFRVKEDSWYVQGERPLRMAPRIPERFDYKNYKSDSPSSFSFFNSSESWREERGHSTAAGIPEHGTPGNELLLLRPGRVDQGDHGPLDVFGKGRPGRKNKVKITVLNGAAGGRFRAKIRITPTSRPTSGRSAIL